MIGGLMKTTSRFAVAAAASMLATSAMAADLGGNCCADLEERVAELEATAARKGNRKVSLTVYGQVNKQLLWHDSGEFDAYRSDKLTVRDNDAAMSRFGFRGEAKIRPDLKAGYQIEIGVLEDKGTGSSKDSLLVRHNFLYLDSDRLGRVSLGQTSQITDGLYEINLANALVTPGGMDESVDFLGGAFKNTFNTPFDGARRQGIYYRTPSVAGFMLSSGYSHKTQDSGATDADEAWEIALRYAGEFNGVRLAAGIGYRHEDVNTGVTAGTENKIWMGSASVMHTPTGLFVSGGYADQDSDDVYNRRDGWWVMAGLERNFFGPGATTLFAEYSQSNFDNQYYHPTTRAGDRFDGQYWGLGVVQKIDAAAMDLYVNFRNYEVDAFYLEPSSDASVVAAGAIIRF